MFMENLFRLFAITGNQSINFLRISVFIVMAWIGGLKYFQYEADGIVPFVTNSPFMSFFYHKSGETQLDGQGKLIPQYTHHKNPEGKTVLKNIRWHQSNGTYVFSYGLGAVIIVIGSLVLSGIRFPFVGFLGGVLTILMSLVTLSFLITTPEAYVADLGGDFVTPEHGFPYLSGAGRLVLKDIIMLAAGWAIASDSARAILKRRHSSSGR